MAATSPSLNSIKVGMPRTPYCCGTLGLSSIFSLATVTWPSISPAISSSAGAMVCTGRTTRPKSRPGQAGKTAAHRSKNCHHSRRLSTSKTPIIILGPPGTLPQQPRRDCRNRYMGRQGGCKPWILQGRGAKITPINPLPCRESRRSRASDADHRSTPDSIPPAGRVKLSDQIAVAA